MQKAAALFPKVTVGLDLGDKVSRICEVSATGEVIGQGSVKTTRTGIQEAFGKRAPCRVVVEAGTHSPWVSREVGRLGHEVVVANPSRVYGPRRRKKRNDRIDAEFLARQGRADVALLFPIQHRTEQAQEQLAQIRARDQLVRVRSKLINHIRGAVKSYGGRIEKCSSEAFHRRAASQIPEELLGPMEPLLCVIEDLTQRIRGMDREIERTVEESYPQARRLQQVSGVGALTALAFTLLVEDPRRFRCSRDVGSFFGLVPRLDESSDSRPQLRITKAGDELGRRLLVSGAQYILGPHGPDCDLKRYGERIAERGGKNAKKRAVVAVARKLAVLLHRLWISGQPYEPDFVLNRRPA